jgi:predicted esterase
LQSGDRDAQVVVYGHGVLQPIEISPPLLSAWGGRIIGFDIARWVHSLSANAKKMMNVMDNVTKLVRANKFTLDTVLYKVGEDAISDAFTKAADASDSAQVVLIFPSLQEENRFSAGGSTERASSQQQSSAQKQKEDDERERLKKEWLGSLFTDQSVAASSPEGPLPVTLEVGNRSSPASLVVWIGDQPQADNVLLKDLGPSIGSSALMSVAWSQHPAGEGLSDFSVTSPEVCDGSWYMREASAFENTDLDTLHDVEILGRSLVETVEAKLANYGLDWKNVIVLGFGKGAGVALYASLLKIFPKPVSAMVLFSPVVAFPGYLAEKIAATKRNSTALKMFTIWGNRNRSTPGNYRQLLAQAIRKAPEVQCTPDTLPDGDHVFDGKCCTVLTSLLPLCLPR